MKTIGEQKRHVFQIMQWPEKETCRHDVNSQSFQSQLLRACTYVKRKRKTMRGIYSSHPWWNKNKVNTRRLWRVRKGECCLFACRKKKCESVAVPLRQCTGTVTLLWGVARTFGVYRLRGIASVVTDISRRRSCVCRLSDDKPAGLNRCSLSNSHGYILYIPLIDVLVPILRRVVVTEDALRVALFMGCWRAKAEDRIMPVIINRTPRSIHSGGAQRDCSRRSWSAAIPGSLWHLERPVSNMWTFYDLFHHTIAALNNGVGWKFIIGLGGPWGPSTFAQPSMDMWPRAIIILILMTMPSLRWANPIVISSFERISVARKTRWVNFLSLPIRYIDPPATSFGIFIYFLCKISILRMLISSYDRPSALTI